MSRALHVLPLAAILAAFASANAGTLTQQSPLPPAASKASNSDSLAEVTVTAQRTKELARKVRRFVNQIAVPENGQAGLARWQAPPACPLVAGLSQRDGEFVLERLSEIGREADVPLAGEHCRPNLYILVTPRPENLLREMEKRNRPFTFGYVSYRTETPTSVVDEFIKTPRAVRVWYNPVEMTSDGLPLMCSATGLCVDRDTRNPMRGRLLFDTKWMFSRVFVIVDGTRLKGMKLGQLADYVTMVGFARLKPDARLGDAPTILKLFDGPPQAAPDGMTDWDRGFLKSLYVTEQRTTQQRNHIARDMVRDIVTK